MKTEMALGVETEYSVGPVGLVGPKEMMGLGLVGGPAAGEVGLVGEGKVGLGVLGAGALGMPPPKEGYTTGLNTEPAGEVLGGTIAALAR
jgi:hypothetical protein